MDSWIGLASVLPITEVHRDRCRRLDLAKAADFAAPKRSRNIASRFSTFGISGFTMNDEQIKRLVGEYGFTGEEFARAFLMAKDVERETRHGYFSLMERANNAASSRDITARELDKFVWDKTQGREKDSSR